jgi:hypothetical protein
MAELAAESVAVMVREYESLDDAGHVPARGVVVRFLEREELEAFAVEARDIAKLAKAEFDALREAGFERADALNIVQVFCFAERDRRREERE